MLPAVRTLYNQIRCPFVSKLSSNPICASPVKGITYSVNLHDFYAESFSDTLVEVLEQLRKTVRFNNYKPQNVH
jgi:hypothetical protein